MRLSELEFFNKFINNILSIKYLNVLNICILHKFYIEILNLQIFYWIHND